MKCLIEIRARQDFVKTRKSDSALCFIIQQKILCYNLNIIALF